MTKLSLKYFSIIVTIYLLSLMVSSVTVDSFPSLLFMGLILLAVNLLLKPILLLVTLPLNLITLGLFSFIVNAWTIMLADLFVPGINMNGFFNSLLAALIIAVIHNLLRDRNRSAEKQ